MDGTNFETLLTAAILVILLWLLRPLSIARIHCSLSVPNFSLSSGIDCSICEVASENLSGFGSLLKTKLREKALSIMKSVPVSMPNPRAGR